MIRILGTVFAGLLGLAFGSFLNVCVSRWPAGESVVKPRSHCRTCARTLTWWENVPLVSWVLLRGRCRSCGTWIGWRYPLVEFAVGGTWALVAWRFIGQFLLQPSSSGPEQPLSFASAGALMALDWVLIFLAALDAESFWIPDAITYPGIALGTLLPVLYRGNVGWSFVLNHIPWRNIGERLLSALIAAVLILLIRWIYWLIRRREGIGLGDAKLMAMLGAWLGLQGALLAFGSGVVLGALAAFVLLIAQSRRGEAQSWALTRLPLGTFLSIGGIVSGLWGEPIIHSYMKWAGF